MTPFNPNVFTLGATPTVPGQPAPVAPTFPSPLQPPGNGAIVAPAPFLQAPRAPGGTGAVDFGTIFSPATTFRVKPRLALSIDAMDKSGKTHYALMTTPDPIVVVMTDPGTIAVIEKAVRAGRRIAGVLDLRYEGPERRDGTTADKQTWQGWVDKWTLYEKAITATVANRQIRTIVKDTETEIWELCQLAHFGKMDKISPHLRVQCNNAYLATFSELYARDDLNVILIHQCKKEYKPNSKGEDSWTGNYERAGMNKIGFQVDLVIRAGWSAQYRCFYTMVPPDQATRYSGGGISGKTWYGPESHFAYLGMEVFPETILTPEIWGIKPS